ncbi:MAG: MBL fold metallo-hydrolase [Deltaproteobacteria bacterium]|nr:MBL fold metallo-hydrolase [Deltaproteobacteria bacterium]
MKIRYNGHSCFSIFAADGTCVVCDPYETGSYGGAIGYLPVDSKPDVVTISHEHPDHNYTKGFSGDFALMRQPGEAKGIRFDVVGADHDGEGGSQRGKVRMFDFTVDGIRVCHAADLGHVLTPEQASALSGVDVLLLPVGGFYTIDANEATDVVETLRPRVVIPMHYKTDKCGFTIDPVDGFLAGKTNVKRIDTDEIELFADRLPGETEILVLKHRL